MLSDSEGPDVDLLLPLPAAEELGRALFLEGSAWGIDATTIDDEATRVSATLGEVTVQINDLRFMFALSDEATQLGERLLARPVTNQVECPSCHRRSWSTTTLAPTSAIAEARGQGSYWTCLHCGSKVRDGDLVEDANDVWRAHPGSR